MNADLAPLVLEEHSNVLAEWHRRGLRGRTLVYLDAHLDLQHVRDARVGKLRAAGSADAFAALEKPSHLLPDGDYVYGLENFLYPASRLGLVEHLIWVAPPHVDIGHSQPVLDHVQQMDGVTFDELLAFERADGGWYEGALLGLPITLCRLADLPRIPKPDGCLIDIDTDFFVALPDDRAWTDPAQVHAVLERSVPRPALVTVSRSVGSGFMPLRYRYFADHLAALWVRDEAGAAHYARLLDLEHGLAGDSGGGDPDRLAALRAELEAFPECPATHHLYAEHVDEARRADAAALCAAYAPDPVRTASETANRHLPTPVKALDALHRSFVERGAAGPREGHVAFGLAYAERGEPDKALDCYQAYAAPHPSLASAIAPMLPPGADPTLREALLRAALDEDASATSAHVQLADLAIGGRDLERARHHAEHAHAAAPAWAEPLRRLAWLEAQAGTGAARNRYARELARRAEALRRSAWSDGRRGAR